MRGAPQGAAVLLKGAKFDAGGDNIAGRKTSVVGDRHVKSIITFAADKHERLMIDTSIPSVIDVYLTEKFDTFMWSQLGIKCEVKVHVHRVKHIIVLTWWKNPGGEMYG